MPAGRRRSLANVRLFVAADIDDATRAGIRSAREQLLRALPAAAGAPRVTWVAEQSAHVTVRFVGEVSDPVAAAIAAALAPPLACAPFDVRWHRLSTFPAGRSPRVVWLGAVGGIEPFVELARLVGDRLDPLLGPGEARPFTPHVTIGRVKDPGRRVDWPAILSRVHIEPTMTRVNHVTLYRSRTSPKGATYTEVSRTALA